MSERNIRHKIERSNSIFEWNIIICYYLNIKQISVKLWENIAEIPTNILDTLRDMLSLVFLTRFGFKKGSKKTRINAKVILMG